MNRSIKIKITESEEELKRLYSQESDKRQAERLQFLYWLKSETVTSLSQAAEQLMCHRHTLSKWLNKYEEGGLKELLRRESPTGKPSGVSQELSEKLDERLENEGFASYKDAYAFMQEHGYPSSYSSGIKHLKKHHGTRLKTARPQHIKQNPEARDAFKKTLLKSLKQPAQTNKKS